MSILDTLHALVLTAILLLIASAIFASPHFLAKQLLDGSLVFQASAVYGASITAVIPIGHAWFHKGLRWWYFLLLLALSGAIAELGRSHFGL